MPQNAPGTRTEPPASVPTDSAPMPVATATALPPLEPPGGKAGSYGFRVIPNRGLSVTAFQPSSGVVVLPSNTTPFSRNRAVTGLSSRQGWARETPAEPRSVGHP